MRAIVYRDKGPSSQMRLAERPVPEPGPGQVRVRLSRAGVNPTDWKARAGASSLPGFAETTPGQDGAGVVDALGPGVPADEAAAVGSRVWVYLGQHGLPHGTAAAAPLPAGGNRRGARRGRARRGRQGADRYRLTAGALVNP